MAWTETRNKRLGINFKKMLKLYYPSNRSLETLSSASSIYEPIENRSKHSGACEVQSLMGNVVHVFRDVIVLRVPSGMDVTGIKVK